MQNHLDLLSCSTFFLDDCHVLARREASTSSCSFFSTLMSNTPSVV